ETLDGPGERCRQVALRRWPPGGVLQLILDPASVEPAVENREEFGSLVGEPPCGEDLVVIENAVQDVTQRYSGIHNEPRPFAAESEKRHPRFEGVVPGVVLEHVLGL